MTRLSCPLPCCGFARCRPFSIFRPSGIMCLKSHPLCVCVCPVLVFNVCATAITLFPPLSRSLALSCLLIWVLEVQHTLHDGDLVNIFLLANAENRHGHFSARGGSHGRGSWWTPPLLLPRLNPGGAGRLLTRNS